MKTYRATMAFNSWNVRYRFFQARDKEGVIAMRPQLCAWLEEEEIAVAHRNGMDPADVPDARIIVDQVECANNSGSHEDMEVIEPDVDEFDRPEDLPMGYHSRIFVQKVADFQITDPSTVEHEILNHLIEEARKLCGK